MDRWEAQSEDVRRSSAKLKKFMTTSKMRENDAGRKSYGRIHDSHFDQDGNARIDDHEPVDSSSLNLVVMNIAQPPEQWVVALLELFTQPKP